MEFNIKKVFLFFLLMSPSFYLNAHQDMHLKDHMVKSDGPLIQVSEIKGKDVFSDQEKNFDLESSKVPIVVLFLSTICPCTNGSMQKISALIDQYEAKGFEIVVVNLDYKAKISNLKKYYRAAGIKKIPIIWDEDLKIAKAFGVKMMAESVVISKSGQMLYRGGIRTEDDQYPLFQALEEIAQGKPVTRPKGDGMGCFLLYPDGKVYL